MTLEFPLLLALALPALQQGREPVLIETGPYWILFEPCRIDASGDVAAAVWQQELTAEVHLSLSDGRGVEWSTPIVLATGIVGVAAPRVEVFEGRAYVLWHDSGTSNPLTAPRLAVVDGASGAVQSLVTVPVPPFQLGGTALAVHRVGSSTRVHVATVAGGTIRLATSNDGGAVFAPPISRPAGGSAGAIEVAAHGDRVHVLRGNWGLFGSETSQYVRSTDGGLSFTVEEPLTLAGSANIRLAVIGDRVAAGAGRTDSQFAVAAMSVDGGDNWGPIVVASWDFGDVEHFDLALTSAGTAVMGYRRDQPSTGIRTMLRRSSDGQSWTQEHHFAPSGDRPTQIVALGDGSLFASWTTADDVREGALSYDEGATFGPVFQLHAAPPTSFSAYQQPVWAWSDLYRNALALWVGGSPGPTITAGGFRPQTLSPVGFHAGATSLGAAFERFQGGTLGALLLTTSTGTLLLPGDGRNLGVGLTPVLAASLDLVGAGIFLAPLDATGAGVTPLLPATLPTPLTLWAVGVALDPATGSLGDLSDVVRIDL